MEINCQLREDKFVYDDRNFKGMLCHHEIIIMETMLKKWMVSRGDKCMFVFIKITEINIHMYPKEIYKLKIFVMTE